jgi:hypothetical protein
VVGRLEFGDEAVRHLDGGGAFRRMLLARREGPADPGKIDERRGRPHQIADDDGGARARGFPPVDESAVSFREVEKSWRGLTSIASKVGIWRLPCG